MSLNEVYDVITARNERRNDEIYSLSNLIRIAVLSVFSEKVDFPEPPSNQRKENNWKNSYNYLKKVQSQQRGCKK